MNHWPACLLASRSLGHWVTRSRPRPAAAAAVSEFIFSPTAPVDLRDRAPVWQPAVNTYTV